MDKCEKEERFEEAATARDRILKLKKIENKRTLEDLRLKQQEEIDIITYRYNEDSAIFTEEYNKQLSELNQKNEEVINYYFKKHQEAKDALIQEFNESYPAQPKFSPEVLNLQKIMEGHIKNQHYEKANEIKIKILNLCEEQDNRHKFDNKNKKLSLELEKLGKAHENEMGAIKRKQEVAVDEFNKRFNTEKTKLDLKFNNRINELKLSHISQINDQSKLNKKNLNTKLTANSK